jgi:hypothetical protein
LKKENDDYRFKKHRKTPLCSDLDVSGTLISISLSYTIEKQLSP